MARPHSIAGMVLLPTPEAIASLSDGSAEDKIERLKEVKTLLVGHPLRKEVAVKAGIIAHLASALASAPLSSKLPDLDLPWSKSQQWTVEDELPLQAATVIASLASGGPAFLAPLCAADVPKILANTLTSAPPAQLGLAALQALHALGAFWAVPRDDSFGYDFWSSVFTAQTMKVFIRILHFPAASNGSHQRSASQTINQHFQLTTGLIAMLPEANRLIVAQSGILDTLAQLLVAHAKHTGIVEHYGGSLGLSIESDPPNAALPHIIAALSNLIAGSNFRAHCFLLSHSVRKLFSQSDLATPSTFGPTVGFAGGRQECQLPLIYVPATRSISHTPVSNHFPAMRSVQTPTSVASAAPATGDVVLDLDHANAVTGWILVLARKLKGSDRLTALKFLARVTSAIDADPLSTFHKTEYQQKTRERERQLTLLAVPITAALIPHANSASTHEYTEMQRQHLQEDASCTLGLLIKNNKELQIAAFEAKVIAPIVSLLKRSFDNVSISKPSWSPRPQDGVKTSTSPSCKMGSRGLPPEILHLMRCREGALQAIAAIAATEDAHRKAIIDAGAVTSIIDSLKQYPPNFISDVANNRLQVTPRDGNTTNVILAACHAARALSRSVTILRTSLIDGGLAKPTVQLLRHPSIAVKIAATDVCCNLAPDFSPLREDLTNNDVLDTLVEHAKSGVHDLNLSSLWSLKHLIVNCPLEFKLEALRKLEPRWLVDLIQENQRDPMYAGVAGGISVGLSSANAAGERVELLNPSSMDVDDPAPAAEDDEDGEVVYDDAYGTQYQTSELRSTLNSTTYSTNSKRYLSSVREIEQSSEYAARRDLVKMQTQALDFIRNFLTPSDAGAMCDTLMDQIGAAKLFDLLKDKLLPIPSSRMPNNNNHQTRVVYHPTELVLGTIYIISHIANGGPAQRGNLVTQTALLRAMIPHFHHHDHNVRVMCVFSVSNLCIFKDQSERVNGRTRGVALRNLGLDQAVRSLANDPVLDVRERVKTALRNLEQLG